MRDRYNVVRSGAWPRPSTAGGTGLREGGADGLNGLDAVKFRFFLRRADIGEAQIVGKGDFHEVIPF